MDDGSTGPAEPIRTDEITDLWSYLSTVNWSEKWFTVLLMFHVTCFALTLTTRNNGALQAILFVILLLSVYFAESLNEIAARNWKLFAEQQYFDSNGLFISIVFSTPVLFNCLILVIIWMMNSVTALSDVRRVKLAARQRMQEKNKETSQKKDN